jgi:hypothetical protein
LAFHQENAMPKDQFADEIHLRQQKIADAGREYQAAALKLVQSPGDQVAQDEMTAIEREVAEHQRGITRLEAAAAESRRRNTKSAKKARFAVLKGQHARLIKSNATAEALAAEIADALNAVGPLLSRLQMLIEDRAADARAITAAGLVGNERDSGGEQRLARFDTGEVTEALAHLVFNNGISVTALRLDPYVTVNAPLRNSHTLSFVDAVKRANACLVQVIDQRVASAAAELNGGQS